MPNRSVRRKHGEASPHTEHADATRGQKLLGLLSDYDTLVKHHERLRFTFQIADDLNALFADRDKASLKYGNSAFGARLATLRVIGERLNGDTSERAINNVLFTMGLSQNGWYANYFKADPARRQHILTEKYLEEARGLSKESADSFIALRADDSVREKLLADYADTTYKLFILTQKDVLDISSDRADYEGILKLKNIQARLSEEVIAHYPPDQFNVQRDTDKGETQRERFLHGLSVAAEASRKGATFKALWATSNFGRLVILRINRLVKLIQHSSFYTNVLSPIASKVFGFLSFIFYLPRAVYNTYQIIKHFFTGNDFSKFGVEKGSELHAQIVSKKREAHRKRRDLQLLNDFGWATSGLLIFTQTIALKWLGPLYALDVVISSISTYRAYTRYQKDSTRIAEKLSAVNQEIAEKEKEILGGFQDKSSIEAKKALDNNDDYQALLTQQHQLKIEQTSCEAEWQLARANLKRSLTVTSLLTVFMCVALFTNPVGALIGAGLVLATCLYDGYLRFKHFKQRRKNEIASQEIIGDFAAGKGVGRHSRDKDVKQKSKNRANQTDTVETVADIAQTGARLTVSYDARRQHASDERQAARLAHAYNRDMLSDHRHDSDGAQRRYDKRYGLIAVPPKHKKN